MRLSSCSYAAVVGAVLGLALLSADSQPAAAQEASASLSIGAGGFSPRTLTVKAGVKIVLTVTNSTSKAAEFESAELNREKVVPPGSSVTVYIGPLSPGTYPFFDDFNQSHTGQIIAR